jgi:hypothetical protein
MNIPLQSIIGRNEDVFAGQIDDEMVMVSIQSGNYFVLNLTARRIWELLETPLSIADVCDKLVQEYAVDPQTCRAEVVQFVEKLQENQIISVF